MNLEGFDIQGHRGCRGLMPENTIPGFLKAIDIGVTTLEMDVVVTRDLKVILSHEPYMSSRICLDSLGQEIPEGEEKGHNIYQMTYHQTQFFDCGSKPVEGFPKQEKMKVNKPLLIDVIQAVEAYTRKKGVAPLAYNIEIKSVMETDEEFHPEPNNFAIALLTVIQQAGIQDRAIIQSFDFRSLHAVKSMDNQVKTAYLIENALDPEANLRDLGYVPEIYSPDQHLVNEAMLRMLHDQGIKVIPWTVNDEAEMRRLIALGVDGIISDYPDRLVAVVKELSGE